MQAFEADDAFTGHDRSRAVLGGLALRHSFAHNPVRWIDAMRIELTFMGIAFARCLQDRSVLFRAERYKIAQLSGGFSESPEHAIRNGQNFRNGFKHGNE